MCIIEIISNENLLFIIGLLYLTKTKNIKKLRIK